MIDRTQIREGMTVYSSDGEKLGKVLSADLSSFIIEKGFFFPKDYVARYEDISSITGDDIQLALTKASFQRQEFTETEPTVGTGAYGSTTGAYPTETTGTGFHDESGDAMRASGNRDDVRMSLSEEELDVVKREREAGEVRLHKDVVTEKKHVEVPVSREEVRVERVPATDRTASPGDRPFQEQSMSVPLHEEEIEVRKRPVVKEEVRLKKDRITEQRAAEADIRKERIDVEGDHGAREVTGERPERDNDLPKRQVRDDLDYP